MGYCVRDSGNSPDAAVLALAAASLHGAIDITSQQSHLIHLNGFLRKLRAGGYIRCLDDLKQEQIWYNWAMCQEKTIGTSRTGMVAGQGCG